MEDCGVVVLEKDQITALTHDELLKYAISLTDSYKSLENRVIALENKSAVSSHCNDLLSKRLEREERHTIKVAQFSKNRQIEIHKVPESIANQDLPKKIADVLSLTGNEVLPSHFDKCHRLGAKKDSVIVEMGLGLGAGRTLRDKILFSRKSLKDKKKAMTDLGFDQKGGGVVITESKCDGFEILDAILFKLKNRNQILDKWFWFGAMYMKTNDGKVHVIKHVNDIYVDGVDKKTVDFLYMQSFEKRQTQEAE